jgi:hypothetical protein
MIYDCPPTPLLIKRRMYRTRIDGTRIDVRVRSKGLTVNRRADDSEHILYEERREPAGSAAGSHLASEVGGRLPGSKNRTGRLRGQTVVLLCPRHAAAACGTGRLPVLTARMP